MWMLMPDCQPVVAISEQGGGMSEYYDVEICCGFRSKALDDMF